MTEGVASSRGVTYSFSWTVELYESNLNESNLFFFRYNYEASEASSVYFKIANEPQSSMTSSSNGRSIETLGITLGLGIPVVLVIILVALFVLLKRKKTTDPNQTQYISN